jgi:fumarate reductase subunit C
MKKLLTYPDYHSKLYRPRMSTYWWLWHWPYMKFILRELSSVPIAYFVALILLQVRAVTQGPEAYAAFQAWLAAPWVIALNVVTLFFVLFHTVTWFNLAPRAMVVRLRGKRVPDLVIAASNYAVWLVVSVVVAWVVLRG